MEETTPDVPPAEGSTAVEHPEAVQDTAVQPQEPSSTPPATDSSDEVDPVKWMESVGINPNDPDAVAKLAKKARNAEKLMHEATVEASQLRNLFSPKQPQVYEQGVDPNLAAISEFAQEYRQDKLLQDFKERNRDWQQYAQPMQQLLSEPITTSYGTFTREQYVEAGMMTLDDIYKLAKADTPVDTQAIKAETQKEVLQTLANTQRAGGGVANASNSRPKTEEYDPIMEGIKRARSS